MPEFVFSAGVGGSLKDGPIAGEKRARTQEMLDVGGLESDEPSPSLPPIPMSFKDKVSGDFGMAEDQLVFSDDDVVIKQGAIPSIQFSDKVKSSLYRPWRSAVIIKLMGRPLAYTFLRSRLLQRWALKGPMSLIDLENNYFIVKFLYEEDMRYVLTGGPWQIAGQYIVAQKWKPGFNAKEEKITHMTAWVRINGLNVEYFRADVMEKIGNLVGATVKVDDHTLSQARGKFARICVELDLAKPLTPFIEIEGRTYGVVYEGINLVCFECGCFGHGRDSCPIILQAKQQVPESDNADCMEDISTVQVNMNLGTATKEAEVPAKMHGEWMLLKPRNFRKNNMNDVGKGAELSKRNTKNTGTKAISPVFGSRFNVLTEEVGREEDMEGSPPVMTSDSRSKKQGSSANTYSTKAKCAGVKSASSRDSGTWVFKKPLKDISNSVVANSSGGGVKSGSVLRRPWKNRAGAKSFSCHDIEPVGLQVKGSDVQDDVRGKFSFNLGGSIFPKLPLGKGGLFFGHEPPDISEMGINEVESSNACDMDHQGNFSEHCESDSGLEADSSFEHDGLEAVEAEHVQI
ncbi:hypothetical protein L3X38_018783 [Prunus dulcis]|uniref:CCHC-type domain-containing protein n=1 Tax=Prunus dulcis TaxID=3755 RepID=A0AAD4WC90_PRUDU|nr:hypothetical protein L3X38_018783 [Prunus dulcis]